MAAIANGQKLSRFIISHFCGSEIQVGWAVLLLQVSHVSRLRLWGQICYQGYSIVAEFAGRCRAEVPFLAGCQPGASPRCLQFLGFLICVRHMQAIRSTLSPFPLQTDLPSPLLHLFYLCAKFSAFNGSCN